MDKTTFKQSYINMAQIIKKSNGNLLFALILVLIPVLIITCYSFYVIYGGEGLNYSHLASFDFESLLTGSSEAVVSFQEAMLKVFPDISYEQNFGDVALDFINTLLIIALDAFVIIFATKKLFEKEISNSVLLKESFKKMPAVMFFWILASWIVFEVQNMIYSSVFMFFAAKHLNNAMFIYSSIASMVMLTVGSILLSAWILLYIRYMTVATVSGRCRFILAFGYAKEVLKGKVWRNMFRIMPYIIIGFIFPSFLKAIAISMADNVIFSVSLMAISTLIELIVFWLLWIYTVPEFFNLEKESGIQEKIQDAIMRAMKMRNSEENEDTNNEDDKKE